MADYTQGTTSTTTTAGGRSPSPSPSPLRAPAAAQQLRQCQDLINLAMDPKALDELSQWLESIEGDYPDVKQFVEDCKVQEEYDPRDSYNPGDEYWDEEGVGTYDNPVVGNSDAEEEREETQNTFVEDTWNPFVEEFEERCDQFRLLLSLRSKLALVEKFLSLKKAVTESSKAVVDDHFNFKRGDVLEVAAAQCLVSEAQTMEVVGGSNDEGKDLVGRLKSGDAFVVSCKHFKDGSTDGIPSALRELIGTRELYSARLMQQTRASTRPTVKAFFFCTGKITDEQKEIAQLMDVTVFDREAIFSHLDTVLGDLGKERLQGVHEELCEVTETAKGMYNDLTEEMLTDYHGTQPLEVCGCDSDDWSEGEQ